MVASSSPVGAAAAVGGLTGGGGVSSIPMGLATVPWSLGAGGAAAEAKALATSAFFIASLVGHVGSRGEWWRCTGLLRTELRGLYLELLL